MKLLTALAFACLFGRASAQPLGPASVPAVSTADASSLIENSKTLLDARDRKDALADAEAAVAAGGGAGAYAARAEAKLSLNEPDEALMDFAEAARLNPARWQTKYEALRAQLEPKGEKWKAAKNHTPGGIALIFVKLLAVAGVVLLVVALQLLRRKQSKSGSEF